MDPHIAVTIVITCPDGFVLLGEDLPSMRLTPNDLSLDVAHDMFKDLTGIDAKVWLSLRQVGFIELPEVRKTVLYAVEVPEITSLLQPSARWVSLQDVNLADTVIRLVTLAWGVK